MRIIQATYVSLPVNSLYKELFSNYSLHDINIIKQQINVDWSSFYNDYLMCWHFYTVSFIPLYKGIKTWSIWETLQHKNCAKTLLKLLCIKHLEFLNNFHILKILES